jgi:hypothetical protein
LGKRQIKEWLLTFKKHLIIDMDNIIHNIMINLADGFPMASIAASSERMRAAINEVNRVDDEENDLIYNMGIKIKDYLDSSWNQGSYKPL